MLISRLAGLCLFLLVARAARAVDVRSADAPDAEAGWASYLPSPAAQPLLGSLGLGDLSGAQLQELAAVLGEAAVRPSDVAALPGATQAELVRAKAEDYAARVVSGRAPADAAALALLPRLAPKHAGAIERLTVRRVEEARLAWAPRQAQAAPVAGTLSAGLPSLSAPTARSAQSSDSVLGSYAAPPAAPSAVPAAPGLPFSPARAFSLAHVAAVMERRLASGKTLNEQGYRGLDAARFFSGSETRRMDTLLSRQAADPAQALLEVIANAQDASVKGAKKVGRFGVGGLQVLGELKEPGDRVVMESGKGDGTAAQFVFWKKDSDVLFDYRLVDSPRRGTSFQVIHAFGDAEAARRRAFLERNLRANDRGPIVWKDGGRVNRPEDFLEWGAPRPTAADAAPVTVSLGRSGYRIDDQGGGMGLKEIFERYLKPYGTDKPVAPTDEPARLLYKPAGGAPRVSLGVTMVEIESLPLSAAGRLNLAGDVFIDLPHDTELTEDRGVVSLVPADQSINGALRGMRLLIDRLTDPAVHDDYRFTLINSVAALIREKQPAHEKGVSRGDPATATDLLWYLRYSLGRSGLLDGLRQEGAAFLPNTARWSALEGLSNQIVFLDPDVFSPTPRDYANAGFVPLPDSLTLQPAWKALEQRAGAVFYSRTLRQDRALAVVGDGVVVLDKSIAESLDNPEVLVARVERELRRDGALAPAAPPKTGSRFMRRVVRPLLLAAAIASAPLLYSHSGSWTTPGGWESYSYSHYQGLGNFLSQESGVGSRQRLPTRPFGVVQGDLKSDAFFVEAIKGRLTDAGEWAYNDARWSRDKDQGSVVGSLEVKYRILLNEKKSVRLFNRVNGSIADIHVKDTSGRDVPFNTDAGDDSLWPIGYSGPATVSYRIDLRAAIGDLYHTENPLPDSELTTIPAKWRRELAAVRDASDADKKAAIEKIMGEDFEYDASKPFYREPNGTWGAKAQEYLSRGERIPIICNTSSLYYYIMARYLGLPAAYVALENTSGNTFYHDLAGHARVLVKVAGEWKYVETTSLMPLKVAADEVLPGGDSGASLTAWLRDRFPSWFGGEAQPQGYRTPTYAGPFSGSRGVGDLPRWVSLLLMSLGAASTAWLAFIAGRGIYRTRRSIRTLRASLTSLGGWQRPLYWAKWAALGHERGVTELRAPWGSSYRSNSSARLYLGDATGRLEAVKLLGSQPRMAAGELIYLRDHRRPWKKRGLYAFDGRRSRLLYRWRFWSWRTPELVDSPGQGVYVREGRRLSRVDVERGASEVVFDALPRSPNAMLLPLESRGGVDRFVSFRYSPFRGKILDLRTLTVSGNSARWDGEPAPAVARYPNNSGAMTAWPRDDGGFLLSLPSQSAETPHRLYLSGRGMIEAPGPFKGVLGGWILAEGAHGLESYDLEQGRWTPMEINELALVDAKRLGEDLFYVRGVKDGRSEALFCAGDGQVLAPAGDPPAAAVLRDGVVYSRAEGAAGGRSIDVAEKGRPLRRLRFSYNPERGYAAAAARVTGLEASAFAALDPLYWTTSIGYQAARATVPGGYQETWAAGVFRADVKKDRAFLDALSPELRAAAPFLGAVMPEWSPARLFLSPDGARAPIEAATRARLDALARANVARPQWLRELFELVDRVYRLDIGSPDAVVGHYLDLVEAVPELLDDIRRALLAPLPLGDGSRVEPLGYLNDYNQERTRGLPPATQLYLQMLKNGAESLLRREKDDAPQGPPSFALDAREESLSRLIAAAQRAPAAELDGEGLAAFARRFETLAEGERSDLSSVRGVVRSQGISAPVWIRELIQNARDAIRETRRTGRAVEPKIVLRSFLSEDGARWIVSVRDGVGMKLSRFLQAMLVPEATTKTMADEVRGFLALGGDAKEKAQRLLAEFFDDAARKDAALTSWLEQAVSGADEASAARKIAEALSDRMRKGGAGFFCIGFFTVFGGADEVIVRTGIDGRLREIALTPVRDENGHLLDIKIRHLREYDGPAGQRTGTEVLRVKNVTPQSVGKLLVENAYVHIMAGKYAGAVSDLSIALNGQSIHDGLETALERGGVRSRIGRSARARWTVDELFIQEPPDEGLALVPAEVSALLRAAGWNLDFPAATAVVRTRASVQSPGRYAPAAAALALPAAYRLYRDGLWLPPGMPSYAQHARVSPWDEPPLPQDLARDAAAVSAQTDDAALWQRYAGDSRSWAKLMLAAHDDKERALRLILGPELCAGLDRLRANGEPLRVGPLPGRDEPDFAARVKALHAEALEKALERRIDLDKEVAATGLRRVLGRLTRFLDDAPPFIPITPALLEGMRRVLDEKLAVPLMEALLDASSRPTDAAAIRLFEGWLKHAGAVQELETLFLDSTTRSVADASLTKLWKAASRGKSLLLALRPQSGDGLP